MSFIRARRGAMETPSMLVITLRLRVGHPTSAARRDSSRRVSSVLN
jgi:hypothetical protein